MFSEYIQQSGHNRATWATMLGISRSYLSDLLNGNKSPSLDLALQIERVTGGAVPPSSWRRDADAAVPPADAEDAA